LSSIGIEKSQNHTEEQIFMLQKVAVISP